MGAATIKSSREVPLAVASILQNVDISYDTEIILLRNYQKKTKPLSGDNKCSHVYCHIINNSQGMGATKICINR